MVAGISYTKQIYFTDILNGYIVNDNGEVFRTTDGGTTFVSVGQTCLQTPFDMQFINDSTGFIVGSFVNASCDVSYTTNYGQTWNSMTFPYQYAGWGVFAFDTANVYLVGQNQTIIKKVLMAWLHLTITYYIKIINSLKFTPIQAMEFLILKVQQLLKHKLKFIISLVV
jgi:hypothetical protein